MSRPSASVPSRCSRLGPCCVAVKSKRDAACDQISGATIASRTITETITNATAPTGLRSTWSQRRDNAAYRSLIVDCGSITPSAMSTTKLMTSTSPPKITASACTVG